MASNSIWDPSKARPAAPDVRAIATHPVAAHSAITAIADPIGRLTELSRVFSVVTASTPSNVRPSPISSVEVPNPDCGATPTIRWGTVPVAARAMAPRAT